MTCASCGTKIADKALICYRCGRATVAPRITPPTEGSIFDVPKRRTRWIMWAAGAAAALGGAWAWFAG